MERHFDAQAAYAAALQIEPDRVSTLTNYGLSLALSGQLVKAEERLRYASTLPGADVRVRQNLALILGLQGRFEDMREVDPHAPKRTVESNLDTLRSMMAPTRTYEALKEEAAPEEDAPAQAPQEKAESSLRLRGALGSD
jgi:Flp pilus assembly protein TadD